MNTPRTVNEVKRLEQSVDIATSRFLSKKGWEYDCSLPGSIWLWKKEINGKTVYVTSKNALIIQEFLDFCGR